MKINYIPLGTRCSSAFVIRDNMGKREQAFPFDWLDMPIKALPKFLKLQPEEVKDAVDKFFEYFEGKTVHRHSDGTWFPHDIEFVNNTWIFKKIEAKEKFERRLTRLSELLNKKEKFVFLTVVFETETYDSKDYEVLKQILKSRVDSCIFITVNLGNETDFINENHYNFKIPQLKEDPGLKIWESKIFEKIKICMSETGNDI